MLQNNKKLLTIPEELKRFMLDKCWKRIHFIEHVNTKHSCWFGKRNILFNKWARFPKRIFLSLILSFNLSFKTSWIYMYWNDSRRHDIFLYYFVTTTWIWKPGFHIPHSIFHILSHYTIVFHNFPGRRPFELYLSINWKDMTTPW